MLSRPTGDLIFLSKPEWAAKACSPRGDMEHEEPTLKDRGSRFRRSFQPPRGRMLSRLLLIRAENQVADGPRKHGTRRASGFVCGKRRCEAWGQRDGTLPPAVCRAFASTLRPGHAWGLVRGRRRAANGTKLVCSPPPSRKPITTSQIERRTGGAASVHAHNPRTIIAGC